MTVERLDIPIAKAEYLFNKEGEPGKGGDKKKFWRVILGFESPKAICEAILAQAAPSQLEAIEPNAYGQRYQAIISITGPSGNVRRIRTIWIVLTGETTARFVTAVPRRRKQQP
ncbi:MAG: DUF6883 domain-containing protein [Cyanobacteria bacterium J06634_5]